MTNRSLSFILSIPQMSTNTLFTETQDPPSDWATNGSTSLLKGTKESIQERIDNGEIAAFAFLSFSGRIQYAFCPKIAKDDEDESIALLTNVANDLGMFVPAMIDICALDHTAVVVNTDWIPCEDIFQGADIPDKHLRNTGFTSDKAEPQKYRLVAIQKICPLPFGFKPVYSDDTDRDLDQELLASFQKLGPQYEFWLKATHSAFHNESQINTVFRRAKADKRDYLTSGVEVEHVDFTIDRAIVSPAMKDHADIMDEIKNVFQPSSPKAPATPAVSSTPSVNPTPTSSNSSPTQYIIMKDDSNAKREAEMGFTKLSLFLLCGKVNWDNQQKHVPTVKSPPWTNAMKNVMGEKTAKIRTQKFMSMCQ